MRPRTHTVSRLDHCQYRLVSQINSRLTNFAEHTEQFSPAALNRYVDREKLSPKLTWENLQNQVLQTPKGLLIFEDTVADQNFSHEIESVRGQYSGNAQAVIKAIGIVTCVYLKPQADQFWIMDLRNQIAGAILVWMPLKQLAHETQPTLYSLKHGWLSNYLRPQLKSPAFQMALA